MDPAQLISTGFSTGTLCVAIWFIAKKLSGQYENRIAALEAEVKECRTDRNSLNDRFISHLTQRAQQTQTGNTASQ